MADELLIEILKQSTAAAQSAAECKASIDGLCDRLEDHQRQDSESFEQLRDGQVDQDARLRGVELGVEGLKVSKDIASEAGAKAGRNHGIGWATVVAGLVTIVLEVWRYAVGHWF